MQSYPASFNYNSHTIELLDPDGDKRPFELKEWQNLICRTSTGEFVWSWKGLKGPEKAQSNHVIVEMKLEAGKLIVWTWSCFRCVLNPETGDILSAEFTK